MTTSTALMPQYHYNKTQNITYAHTHTHTALQHIPRSDIHSPAPLLLTPQLMSTLRLLQTGVHGDQCTEKLALLCKFTRHVVMTEESVATIGTAYSSIAY